MEVRSSCRSCGSTNLQEVLSLGEMPLADALPRAEQLIDGEARYPVTVVFCGDCCLMQIRETVPPEVLFCRDYPYYSSFSEALLRHSRQNAFALIESRKLGPSSLVIELASNDGYLLKNFKERSVPVLGIDPAEGPVRDAVSAGIPTLCQFFGTGLAQELAAKGQQADVIIANNVLAHVADLNGFVEGIRVLLKDAGVAVIEVPYVRDLIDHCEFDTIYHEHLCYFSVSSVAALFKRHGLTLNDVEHLSIHGGSLRLYASRQVEVSARVKRYLLEEEHAGVTRFDYYRDFAEKVLRIKRDLSALVQRLKMAGKSIAAYGAAAKGATLLNFTGIDNDLIDFVVDRNVHKHNLYMPGVRVPIRDPGELLTEMPDYVLLLAWNFKDEVMKQQEEYIRRGGKWIVPIPCPEILETEALTNEYRGEAPAIL